MTFKLWNLNLQYTFLVDVYELDAEKKELCPTTRTMTLKLKPLDCAKTSERDLVHVVNESLSYILKHSVLNVW